MSKFQHRLAAGALLTACALAPVAAHAYPYGGYRGYGYGGFGVGLGVGLLAGGYYGYYGPRPYYYYPPPVVYAPPPVYYAPAPRVAYEVPPPPPVRHPAVHRARIVRRAPTACVVPPVLNGPLPRGPLENPLPKAPTQNP
jgi:hypothetical protein